MFDLPTKRFLSGLHRSNRGKTLFRLTLDSALVSVLSVITVATRMQPYSVVSPRNATGSPSIRDEAQFATLRFGVLSASVTFSISTISWAY